MSSSNQLYANGRIAVLSTKLLGADKFVRLAECSSIVEAVRVLTECGYGGGTTVAANEYETLLRAELDQAIALMKELCYDDNAVKYFLCKYDYANAKVLMKSKYMRSDGTAYCFVNATYDPSQMQSSFVVDDYSQVSGNMAKALNAIDEQYANGNRSAQIVDELLDKAMFQDMRMCAKKSSVKFVEQLYNWQVDTTNLMLVYRLKKAGLTKDDYERWIVDGGSVKKEKLLALWDNDIVAHDLNDKLREFYQLCNATNLSLALAEKAQQTYRNAIVAENADLLTIQPAIEYFYKKVDETEKVRRVLVDVKNGVDKDKIKDRLK